VRRVSPFRVVPIGDVHCGAGGTHGEAIGKTSCRCGKGTPGGHEESNRAEDDEQANDKVREQSIREIGQANRTAVQMTTNAAAAAELAALVSAVEQCRSRLTSLAEARLAARRSDDEGDSLLTAIYEAERGLNAAIRMLQRAQRTAR